LWTIVALWVLISFGLYFTSFPNTEVWYIPGFFGVIAGAWVGYRYYYWVAGLQNRATLVLVTFGSLVLAFLIAEVFLAPFFEATSPFNQAFGISYSGSYVGFASSLAAFGTPLVLMVGFSILYAGYKASITIFVRYE
jgi:hypothetical protein